MNCIDQMYTLRCRSLTGHINCQADWNGSRAMVDVPAHALFERLESALALRKDGGVLAGVA